MVEKIRHTYTVFGKTFSTYAEAVQARKAMRPALLRAELRQYLGSHPGIHWREPEAEEIVVDALLEKYDVRRKKEVAT